MRDDLEKLKNLSDRVININLDIAAKEKEIFNINKDLKYLKIVELAILENLKVLKKEKIIVVASEYKKTVDELDYLSKRISEKISIIKRGERDLEKMQNRRLYLLEEYAKQKSFIISQKVILHFDHAKKKVKGGK